eukprot:666097-Lingulodinium_polyedra.AAC.1
MAACWRDARRLPHHWHVRSNGDLWACLHKLIHEKGVESFRLTKVKSHTSREDVEQGIISAVDRAGNGAADQLADQ